VTTHAPLPKHRVCLYCGLQSPAASHGNVGECVDALQCEVDRLRGHLRESKRNVAAVGHAGAASVRLRRAS
jgi:hypothetical protein